MASIPGFIVTGSLRLPTHASSCSSFWGRCPTASSGRTAGVCGGATGSPGRRPRVFRFPPGERSLSTTTTALPWGAAAAKALAGGFGFGTKKKSFPYTGTIRPAKMSPTRVVPDDIPRPDYAIDGIPKARKPTMPWDIVIQSPEDIAAMRVVCRMAREVLDAAGRAVRVGATTDEIDAIVHAETIARGAYPSPLNYNGFPKSCCTSVNEVVCHGFPNAYVLRDGDIINVDVTCYYGGFHGDCSETFLVGNVDARGRELVKTTYDCLNAGIAVCKPGVPYHNIGGVIEDLAHAAGFTTTPNFCGHGVHRVFHDNPTVLHYRNVVPNGVMKPGITFTIEPMINEGTAKNVMWPDDWTATTKDGKRSAQFEHTLLITEDGVERLTARLPTSVPFFWEEE